MIYKFDGFNDLKSQFHKMFGFRVKTRDSYVNNGNNKEKNSNFQLELIDLF